MERRQFVVGTSSMVALGLAGCVGGSGGETTSPEGVVEAFFTAAADGDVERQQELLHPDSSTNPIEEEVELTINEINSVTLEEFAEQNGRNASDENIERQREQLNEELDSIGADDYSFVIYRFETEEYGTEEGFMILVEDDGEWLIYQVN